MSGFNSPNHTQVPNDLFDRHMSEMERSELLVVLAAIRQTLGYHKHKDAISLTQFERMTGLSRTSVVDGIEHAIKRGLLRPCGTGKRGVIIYELVISDNQSNEATSSTTLLVPVAPDYQTPTVTSSTTLHTKETKKRNSTKQSGGWAADLIAISQTFGELTHAMVNPHEETSAKTVETNRQEAALIAQLVSPDMLRKFYKETYSNGYTPSSLGEIRKKLGAWQAKQRPPAPDVPSNYADEMRAMTEARYKEKGLLK
jgi:phage replication O-like protein O